MKKPVRFLAVCAVFLMLAGLFCMPVQAGYDYSAITRAADAAIKWRKTQSGTGSGGYLFTESYAKNAGNGCDWYAIAAGRYGITDNPRAYLKNIERYITQKYKTQDKLDAKKATEWHRIALAVLACGGNPTSIGQDANGSPVNLIADGVYNRGCTMPLAKQGINGYVWGLIALDSKRYQTPQGSCDTREDIIRGILEMQLTDGGFALAGSKCDPDTTAAVITALAPYCASGTVYTYVQKSKKTRVTKTAGQAVQEALGALSGIQQHTGGFITYGEETCESTAQVLVALCAANVDPQSDRRFIKGGKSAVDALFSYRRADGGFAHTCSGASNSIATEQALCALVALYRLYNGIGSLYDYTDGIVMKADSPADGLPSVNTGTSSVTQNNGGPSTSSAVQNHVQQGQGAAQSNTGASSAAESNVQNSGSTTQGTAAPLDAEEKETLNAAFGKTQATQAASALVQPSSGVRQQTESTQQPINETGGDNTAINPVLFIGVGLALIAGGVGFNAARIRRQKQSGTKDDFFASLKTFDEEEQKEEPDFFADIKTEKEKANNPGTALGQTENKEEDKR